MLKWLLWIAAAATIVILLVLVTGALLPRDHVAAGEAKLAAGPDRVAAMIRDVEAQPRWRHGVRSIEVLNRGNGRVRYVEHSGDGAITYELVEEQPGRRFRSVIADPGLPFGGSWTIDVLPEGAGSRVRIEERGFVGNIVYRFVSALLLGHDRTLKAYLPDLERAPA